MEETITSLTDRKFLINQVLQQPERMQALLNNNTKLTQTIRRDLTEFVNAGQDTGINIFDEMNQPLLHREGTTRLQTRWIDCSTCKNMET